MWFLNLRTNKINIKQFTVYNFFMPLPATVKTIARGVVDDPVHKAARPRAIVHRVNHNTKGDSFDSCLMRHEVILLLSNQSKSNLTLCLAASFTSNFTESLTGRQSKISPGTFALRLNG